MREMIVELPDLEPTPPAATAVPFADGIDRLIEKVGAMIAWLYLFLVAVIITQVMLRKGFSNGLVILEELQWHLYATAVMFGLSFAQVKNSHIRVDLLYGKLRAKSRYFIDSVGILFLALPFVAVIFIHSLDFVHDAWRINEHSDSPSGLPWRWIIKGVIPCSMLFLGLAMLSRLYRNVVLFCRGESSWK